MQCNKYPVADTPLICLRFEVRLGLIKSIAKNLLVYGSYHTPTDNFIFTTYNPRSWVVGGNTTSIATYAGQFLFQ